VSSLFEQKGAKFKRKDSKFSYKFFTILWLWRSEAQYIAPLRPGLPGGGDALDAHIRTQNIGDNDGAVRLLVEGVGIPESRMTVSTAGIVPRIYDLGTEPVRPKLAISLNAPTEELRGRLMPINRKWNLEKLMAAARGFPLRSRERLTFEYVLLDEVNDSAQNARELGELIRGVRAKVNLIALNPGPGIAFQTPAQERVAQFQKILVAAGVPTFIRRPRGRDIYAACGQLKRTLELAASR